MSSPNYTEYSAGLFAENVQVMGGSIGTVTTLTSITQFVPIEKANLHNTALPAANTNWLGASLSPTSTPCKFQIQVCVSIAGNFNVTITKAGNTQTVTLNSVSGPALIAGGLYNFEILVCAGDTINFQYSTTTGTIQVFRVLETEVSL